MNRTTEFLLFLYAESPVHAGAADSEGVLDLPVQREVSTGYPVIWGQSLKGALRQAAEDAGWGEDTIDLFGPTVQASGGSGLEAGRLVVGDARLVALPVATLRRCYAWVTTTRSLGLLSRAYARLERRTPPVPSCLADEAVAVGDPWTSVEHDVLGPCVLDVRRDPSDELGQWADRIATDGIGSGPGPETFAAKFRTDLLLVGEDLASPLLKECTEISVRVQLDENKTVANGPFHTEYLPGETLLAASLSLRPARGAKNADEAREDRGPELLRELLHGQLLQVGGDETIGKGLVWCRLVAVDASPAPGSPAAPAGAA